MLTLQRMRGNKNVGKVSKGRRKKRATVTKKGASGLG